MSNSDSEDFVFLETEFHSLIDDGTNQDLNDSSIVNGKAMLLLFKGYRVHIYGTRVPTGCKGN